MVYGSITMRAAADNTMQKQEQRWMQEQNKGASPGLIAGVIIASLLFVTLTVYVAYRYWKMQSAPPPPPEDMKPHNINNEEDSMMDYSLNADSSSASSAINATESYLKDRVVKKLKQQSEEEIDKPQSISGDDFSYDQVGDTSDEEIAYRKSLNKGVNEKKTDVTTTDQSSHTKAADAPFDEETTDEKLDEMIVHLKADVANAIEVIERGSRDEDFDLGPEIIVEDSALPSYPYSYRRGRSNLSNKSDSFSEDQQQDELAHFLRERRKEARKSRASRKQPPISMEI